MVKTKTREQVKSHAFQIRRLDQFTLSKFTKNKSPEEIKLLFEQLEKELPQEPKPKYKRKEYNKYQNFWSKEDFDTLIAAVERHGIDDYEKLWKPLKSKFSKIDIGRKIRAHKFLWDYRCVGKHRWRSIKK